MLKTPPSNASADTLAPKQPAPAGEAVRWFRQVNLQVFVMIAVIIAIMLFFTLMTDGSYLSARNVSNLLRQTAITGILAVGMVFVIVSPKLISR